MSTANMDRYQRQVLLPGFGRQGQECLFTASVLVVGAGGLGCPVLLYLAAAGIGRLGIADFDQVALSNLHRQVLYDPQEVGQPKALVAAQKLRSAYPDTDVIAHNTRLHTGNALDILSGYDLVVDGSDNFPTRYLLSDACRLLGKPLVWGSVYRYEGQVAVFNVEQPGQPAITYRDLFPQPPAPHEAPNCAEAGVLGVLPGIIGSLQANEVIKLITGLGEPLAGRLLTYHSLHNTFYEIALSPQPDAQKGVPQTAQEFREMRYAHFCGLHEETVTELEPAAFAQLARQEGSLLVDVRQPHEQPKLEGYPVLQLPLPHLQERRSELEGADPLLLFCQAGSRSRQAAQQLASAFPHKPIYSLKGGIAAWYAHYQQAESK